MTVKTESETLQFQAEVNQLLKLMIHSLYSNKEIFLRELISNASDACDKLRFAALAEDTLYAGDSDLKIRVDFDSEQRTVTVSDNGIGMNRDEVIANIGTIAKSGTQQFLKSMTGDQAKDAHLIGQFGVGFYSSFIVADRVELISRRAGEPAEAAVRWQSDGMGSYTVGPTTRDTHGTDVILHLNEEAGEFLDAWRLRGIIKKYSDHITFPVEMKKALPEETEGEAGTEVVNSASALWRLPRKQIEDDEYKAFYKHLAHDFEDPLTWTHNQVEGNLEYTSLFYIPARAPFDLWDRDHVHGIKLYVQRVFIMDDAEHLMPRYLRFVRGLVDSNDLPLNVSREILQSNKVIDSIRRASVKKVLGLLADLASKDGEKYQSFWNEFGRVLKEGPAEDSANRDELLPLLRFASTREDRPEQSVSLADYVSRMQPGQDNIYYVTADSFTAAKNSPHLERLRSKGVEALLLYDRVDEWLMSYLTEFDGKKFVSAAKGELDLDDAAEAGKDNSDAATDQDKTLLERFRKALGDRVEDVRASKRLERSPACLVLNEHEMALHMQALLKQAGHSLPGSKPILELNLVHPLVRMVGEQAEEDRFADWAGLLFDQALLAEGGQLEDPAGFVLKLNDLVLALSGAPARQA